MPLWLTTANTESAGTEKPKYLANTEKTDTYGTSSGWVYRRGGAYTDMHGNVRRKEEILVAVRELSGANSSLKLANAVISEVQFGEQTRPINSLANVILTFNQEVNVVGVPTFDVQVSNTTSNTVLSTTTCSYVDGSGSNRLTFNFTTQSNAAIYDFSNTGVTLVQNGVGVFLTDKDASETTYSDLQVSYIHSEANSAIGSLRVTG